MDVRDPPPAGQATSPDWITSSSRRLGRYLVGPLLGSGGMGEVHEAWDTLLRRPVALKILRNAQAGHLLRFLQEAQLQARVDHPNICRIYDAEVVDGTPIIAMRLVRGTTLFEAATHLSESEIVAILRRVAEAMHAAHRLHLVHRDLKPANILLERNEWGHWIPYVTDFGLAKDLSGKGMTQTHAVMGTPAFMAPEQLRGETARIGPPTDIYALGATLQDALEGCPTAIFEGSPQSTQTPPGPSDANSAMGRRRRDLATILARCQEECPEDRYPSAAVLAEDLRRFLEGEPLLARPVGWVGTLYRRGRKHPWVTLSVAGSLALAAGLAGWNIGLSLQARRRESIAQGFIARAKDMEYLLRIERMRPPHDLRPAFIQIRSRLEELKVLMASMGPAGQGPGHYALGRGYLALREHEVALRELEEAWTTGYRVPEVAYSIGKAHCEAFSDRRWEALAAGEQAVQALRQEHLVPARYQFSLAGGQSLEPAALGEAQLALLEGHADTACAKAREAQALQPWNADAKRLEAAAWFAKGYDFQYRGQMPEAEDSYREANALALAAMELARSDEAALDQYLQQRMEWALKKLEDRTLTLKECDELVAISDRLLVLDPDSPTAISWSLNALNNRASHLSASGQDPRPDARRGLDMAARAVPLSDPRNKIGLGLMRILHQQAEYEYNHGLDPRPTVLKALQAAPPGDDRCETILIAALWEIEHGMDPVQSLKALEVAVGISMRTREYAYHHYYLGNGFRLQGLWEAQAGRDPRPMFTRAIQEQEIALQMNPEEKWCWIELARTRAAWARLAPAMNGQLRRLAEQAIADGEKAIALSPRSPFPFRAAADAYWTRACLRLNGRLDPSRDITAGLRHIKTAIRKNPDRWAFHLVEARLHLIDAKAMAQAGSDPTAALAEVERALQHGSALNPANADLLTVGAEAALLKNRHPAGSPSSAEVARSRLNAAIAINPLHQEARRDLAAMISFPESPGP